MHKNIIIGFLFFSITLSFITYIIIKSNKEENLGSAIAIMVYDDKEKNYVNSNEVPKGMKLNREKTKCTSGGIVTNYDVKKGTITYSLDAGDYCYIFFDKKPLCESDNLVECIKEVYENDDNQENVTNGLAGIYHHDKTEEYLNANKSADDGSYRYAGADPNNYVCFQEDVKVDGTCDYDNLYRIIGVIDNKVKLIKYTDINTSNTLAWNSSNKNTWKGSTLEIHLNGTYLNSLTFKDKIDTTLWYVEGMPYSSIDSPNTVKDIYDAEISGDTLEREIGLMYVSDYGYAALPEYWTTNLHNYSSSKGSDWMVDENETIQWTVTRGTTWSSNSFYVYNTGDVGGGVGVDNYAFGVHPSFNLLSSAKITNASVGEEVGSKDVPMIIS